MLHAYVVDQGNHICLVCKPALKCMNLSTGHGIRTAFGRLEPVVQGWLFLNCFPHSQVKSCRTQSRRLSVDFLRLLSTLIHLAIQQTFSVEEGFFFVFFVFSLWKGCIIKPLSLKTKFKDLPSFLTQSLLVSHCRCHPPETFLCIPFSPVTMLFHVTPPTHPQ